nr:hypothetical protein [Clostridium beijerinckii]
MPLLIIYLEALGANIIESEPMAIDNNIITSYNPSISFDVAFKLLELLTSKKSAITLTN